MFSGRPVRILVAVAVIAWPASSYGVGQTGPAAATGNRMDVERGWEAARIPWGDSDPITSPSAARSKDDTLVVETMNFTDQTNYMGSRDNLHLLERFRRVGPDLLMYHATIDVPTVFTRPWTIEVPLTKRDDKANQIFESACYEGVSLGSWRVPARWRENKLQRKPSESRASCRG